MPTTRTALMPDAVIPAQAGIQSSHLAWTPAFAGVTSPLAC